MAIKIKNYKVLRSILEQSFHPIMIALAIWIVHRYTNSTITSGWRKEKIHDKDSGIHSTIPCRAIDWRSNDFDDPQEIEYDINNHWEYDPERPNLKCALYHNSGYGFHFHTQVHPRTKYHPEGRFDASK